MNKGIHEKHLISPYQVFTILYVSMVGVGVLSFQKDLDKYAGYNAWISVLLMGGSIHFVLWMIYKILSSDQGLDITAINQVCFGKLLGNLLNLALVVYFYFGAFIECRAYLQVIQAWIFPAMDIWPLSILLLLLIYYTVSGGFRSIAALSLWGLAITIIFIIPQIGLVLPYVHPLNLLPLFNHSITDILLSTKNMTYHFLGIEVLLIFYPFIKTPVKSQKWAHFAVLFSTLLYLGIVLTTFMFFSEGLLHKVIWPTLRMIMIIEVPMFQRLEYLAISAWLLKFIASISLGLWAASRIMKHSLRIRPRLSLVFFLAGFWVLEVWGKDRNYIRWIIELYQTVGFYFIYGYIPLMFALTQIKRIRGLNRVKT